MKMAKSTLKDRVLKEFLQLVFVSKARMPRAYEEKVGKAGPFRRV